MPLARTIASIASFGLAFIIALPSLATAGDYGTAYAPPGDRRPLDGSYRDGSFKGGAYGDRATSEYAASYGPMTWTGLYAGAHGGWGGGGSDVSGAINQSIDSGGFLGGLHAGYNFQYQSVVAGLEGDIDWASVTGDETKAGTTYSADANWLSSLRLRLGYAANNLLIYGTGGIAFSGYDLNVSGAGPDANLSQTITGFAVGIGAEYAFTKSISGRVEALHYGFGEDDFKIGSATSTADLDITTVRGGISLKLN